MSNIVTRFAPSPTGYLHIGGARTALFNWLYARKNGGKYLLRIEDTDRARSTQAAVDALLDGLSWLGLEWDGEAVSQFQRAPRHAEVAHQLIAKGRAYRCWCTPAELEAQRAKAMAEGRPPKYDGRCRQRTEFPSEPAAIRFLAPQEGSQTISDRVQGEVTVPNSQLDDMIILRADGTPTYLLAVVVDDHDMGVTHIIRGDDHLTNAFRQLALIRAMEWPEPSYSHVPLIHGPDGAKLSKRHGALAVDAYRDMGYLPETMRNYLLRLGWGHGDEEILSTERMLELFDLDGIGRAPSRLDFAKLDNLNGHYIREANDARLAELARPMIEKSIGRDLTDAEKLRILAGMPGMKARAKTVVELAEGAVFYVQARPIPIGEKARELLNRDLLGELATTLKLETDFSAAGVEGAVRKLAEIKGVKLGQLAQPLRAALSGSNISPPIFEVASVLGREETIGRLQDAMAAA